MTELVESLNELAPNPSQDEVVAWYAVGYLADGFLLREVIYLPDGSPPWEIRFVHVLKDFRLPPTDELEPLNMSSPLKGVERHTVFGTDVTAEQWQQVLRGEIRLPPGMVAERVSSLFEHADRAMNEFQRLFWVQAKSEYERFEQFRETEVPVSHLLHYLQMSNEKLAKAFFWYDGTPPKKSHAFLLSMMRTVRSRPELGPLFGFNRAKDFEAYIHALLPIAAALEKLAPDLALDGPNAEYPWPPDKPTETPVEYDFPLWHALTETATGKRLLQFLETAFETFPRWDA